MGKIPNVLREDIAANIKQERLKRFPHRGGGKECAETFGVSPQQWSPWERGMRTPDELRLENIAAFFEVSVEYLRRPATQRKVLFPDWEKGIRAPIGSDGAIEQGELPPNGDGHFETPNLVADPPATPALANPEEYRKRRAIETYCRSIYDMIILGIDVQVTARYEQPTDKPHSWMNDGKPFK